MNIKQELITILEDFTEDELYYIYNYALKLRANPEGICSICGSDRLEQMSNWNIKKLYCSDCGAIA